MINVPGSPSRYSPDGASLLPDVSEYLRTSLIGLLEWRAAHQPDRIAYTFLNADGETSITYGQLASRAQAVGRHLHCSGSQGDRAILVYPPCLDFIVALFGCLYAGFLAVPAYPPRAGQPAVRLNAIVADTQPAAILTITAIMPLLATAESTSRRVTHLATDALSGDAEDRLPDINLTPATAALLQYTSGSTSRPRGVVITHGNLLNNSMNIARLFDNEGESRAVVWLPFYHDMGLIGGIFQPLYAGFPMALMSPLLFLQSPFPIG